MLLDTPSFSELISYRNQSEPVFSLFQIQAHQDPFLRSIAHWVLEDYSRALDTLLEHPAYNASARFTVGECEAGKSAVLFMLQFFPFILPLFNRKIKIYKVFFYCI